MKEIFIPLSVEEMPGGGYLVTCEELPGLVAQGKTEEEALSIARDVAHKLVQSYMEHEDLLPPVLQDLEDEGEDPWNMKLPN